MKEPLRREGGRWPSLSCKGSWVQFRPQVCAGHSSRAAGETTSTSLQLYELGAL